MIHHKQMVHVYLVEVRSAVYDMRTWVYVSGLALSSSMHGNQPDLYIIKAIVMSGISRYDPTPSGNTGVGCRASKRVVRYIYLSAIRSGDE